MSAPARAPAPAASRRLAFARRKQFRRDHAALAVSVDRPQPVAALRESEERLRRFIEEAPPAMAMFDTGMRYLAASRRWLDDYRLGEDVMGQCHYDVFPEVPQRWRDVHARCLAGATERQDEDRYVRRDGAERWLRWEARPWRTAEGDVGGIVLFTEDITDRKQYEAALREREDASARLAAIVSASDDAIVSKTLEGRVLSWNAGAERLFGYTADEMVGQSILRIIPPERHAEEDTILAALREGRRIEHYESVRRRKDGAYVDVSLTVFPIRDSAGRPVAAAKVARDISSRKRADEERRRHEAEYRTLFEAAGTGNAEVDLATGRLVRVNRKYCEMLGYSEGELLGGKTVYELTHPDDRAHGVGVEPLLREGGATFEVEKRYVRKDGAVIWVHLTATALYDGDGRPTRSFGSVIDITQRRLAEEALRVEDRRKDEFLATLAHELRNPLAPVRNAVALMKMPDAGSAETIWARDVIDRQVETMARLIDDLLDVSRITLGKVDLRLEPADLAKVLLDSVETSRPLIGADAHALTIELPPDPVIVLADTTRLSQVFANLLNNAAKYTARGGSIALAAQRADGEAVVTVTDNGVGIPPDKLAEIFDLFTQVRSEISDAKGGGLGIGLSLARRLVQMHGGTIEAKSAGAGRGSTFTVRLPLGAVHATLGAAPADRAAARPSTERRVLVVDDNRDAATSLAMLLGLMGNAVETAFDGLEAVQVAERFDPDVILLDIGLPRLNGYDACRRIRALPGGSRPLILAVTGWGQESDRTQARDAGFDDHLVKPVDPQALMERVAEPSRRSTADAV